MKVVLCVVILMASLASGDVLVGGFSNLTDENKINELKTVCLERLNHATNSPYLKNAVKVVSAQKQIVAGVNYKLVIQVGTTSCKKDANTLVTDCQVDANQPIEECTFEVWEKPWENFRQITIKGCKRI